ncbi:MAG: hypothetical protein L0220_06465 [Acidobacteria bacterium]|nr:hypothetical protein [Acidobacteriota bacterium]
MCPIIGVTDELSNMWDGLLPIGKIRKGDERSPEDIQRKRPGKDLKHFRVTFREEYAYLSKQWEAMYGKNPEKFEEVHLIGNTVGEAFPSWYEEHIASRLLRRCDGHNQVWWYDINQDRYSEEPRTCLKKAEKPCGCKWVGTLKIVLPEFIDATGILGYLQLNTSSFHDIRDIHKSLSLIYGLSGLPISSLKFTIGRVPKKIWVPKPDGKSGERIKVSKSLLYLHPEPEAVKEVLMRLANRTPALPPATPTDHPDTDNPILNPGEWVDEDGWIRSDEPKAITLRFFWDDIQQETASLFNAPQHQENTMRQMVESGELNDAMTKAEAVEAIRQNRARRLLDKIDQQNDSE